MFTVFSYRVVGQIFLFHFFFGTDKNILSREMKQIHQFISSDSYSVL